MPYGLLEPKSPVPKEPYNYQRINLTHLNRTLAMTIGILSYGAGNTASVLNAIKRLGYNAVISSQVDELEKTDKLIFPGVGHAAQAMASIKSQHLDILLRTYSRPVLGICLGMQLLGRYSAEGSTTALGIIPFDVKHFSVQLKVPHMGWNAVEHTSTGIFKQIPSSSHFYFVHSYYVPQSNAAIAICNYQIPFTAAVAEGNYYGVQFHPEKSGDAGAQLLQNFINI